MSKPAPSSNRVVLSFVIAAFADVIQLPINATMATGVLALPAEMADFVLDCFVMLAISLLIGFHWALLPSLFLEAIPGIAMLPTWTACVALVVKVRKDEGRASPSLHESYGRQTPTGSSPLSNCPPLPLMLPEHAVVPAHPPPIKAVDVEARLLRLNELLARNLISLAEYEAKRQQILAEI